MFRTIPPVTELPLSFSATIHGHASIIHISAFHHNDFCQNWCSSVCQKGQPTAFPLHRHHRSPHEKLCRQWINPVLPPYHQQCIKVVIVYFLADGNDRIFYLHRNIRLWFSSIRLQYCLVFVAHHKRDFNIISSNYKDSS